MAGSCISVYRPIIIYQRFASRVLTYHAIVVRLSTAVGRWTRIIETWYRRKKQPYTVKIRKEDVGSFTGLNLVNAERYVNSMWF